MITALMVGVVKPLPELWVSSNSLNLLAPPIPYHPAQVI